MSLQLALKHKTHVDTVLAFREKHLTELGSKETLAKFIECQGKVSLQVHRNALITGGFSLSGKD
jgi:hypothetical protein